MVFISIAPKVSCPNLNSARRDSSGTCMLNKCKIKLNHINKSYTTNQISKKRKRGAHCKTAFAIYAVPQLVQWYCDVCYNY
eukprot:259933-Amphidinium_carterae.1